ncbi:MAG: single-stranded DNA-binding protein [Clostridium sp.]|uniref:single-stranded DNA-binding protein n=1 Tax=Clostridium sp. TaxID=1506 RepID=UPI002906BCAF|nr:single-stranded DNA-binding protein [Clostridium sp.]MDU5110291.1 single-stranded DNA-binding protein [Clostridium sp.]
MNKVILIGRLTKDPELSHAQGNGTAICRFSLAVTRPFKKDETDFINCISFGKTGEIIVQYMTKGRQLGVVGSIRTGSYDSKDGTKRYTTDVIIESFDFIGNGQSNNSNGFNNSGSGFGGNFEEDMTPIDDGDMPF